MKTEMTRIKLKLSNHEVELTVDEAREVYAELGNLFGELYCSVQPAGASAVSCLSPGKLLPPLTFHRL